MHHAQEHFEEPWLIRTDVASYYHEIHHVTLLELLKNRGWLNDKNLLSLFHECLTAWRDKDETPRGIPVGYDTSDYLANLYLIPLDNELSNHVVLRYVDDIYVLVDGRSVAERVVKQIDVILNSLYLERNVDKTKFRDLRENTKDDIENEIRSNLSSLLDSDQNDRKQKELLEKFYEVYDGNPHKDDDPTNICSKDKILDPSAIAFVLYRLREPDDLIRGVALCMLDYYPDYSKHATTYLARNYDWDNEVVNELYHRAQDALEHTQVRIHCLEALIAMRQFRFVEDYLKTAQFADWFMRYSILDLFPKGNSDHFSYLFNIATHDLHPLVHTKAKKLAFELTENRRFHIVLINSAIGIKDEFSKKLAIYLWRQQIDISEDDLSLSYLGELQDIFIQDLTPIRQFHKNFESLFNFMLHESFPVDDVFGSRKEANQIALSARDCQEQDMNGFVLSLYELTRRLLHTCAEINYGDTLEYRPVDVLVNSHFHTDSVTMLNTGALCYYYKKAQNGSAHPNGKLGLVAQLQKLYHHHVGNLHEFAGLPRPIFRKIEAGSDSFMYDVFVCYNKNELDEVESICRRLKKVGIQVYLDDWEIPPGSQWQSELEEGIVNSRRAMVCIGKSGMGPWQREEQQAILNRFIETKRRVIPVLLQSAPNGHEDMPVFLGNRDWVDFRRTSPDPFEDLLWGITDIKPKL